MADESQAKGVARAEADGRRRRGDRARSAILGRAIQIASTEGIEGLTLGRLAADLGIGKANISVLFGDKETLKLKTLDAAVDVFIETVVRPHATIGSPLGRLRAWCGAWFDYVEARVLPGGCMLHAASSEYRARPGVMQDRVRQHRDAWRRLLTGAAREALAARELRQADAEQLVF
ncbi:MAG: TetR/AcrR family transcriptional regulator [Caulobacteraceae bacterium]